MAVLLMLMYVHRGVLKPQQVAPVYTFGSPGVMCAGALGSCSTCVQDTAAGAEACSQVVSGLCGFGVQHKANLWRVSGFCRA